MTRTPPGGPADAGAPPVPAPRAVRMTVSLPAWMVAYLRQRAAADGRSISGLIREALEKRRAAEAER